MKHFKALALTLIAACALGGAISSPSLAAEECQRVFDLGSGRFADTQCATPLAGGEYIKTKAHTSFLETVLGDSVWCAATTGVNEGNYTDSGCTKKGVGSFIKVYQGPFWHASGSLLMQGTRQIKLQLKGTTILEVETTGEHLKITCNTSISEGVAIEGAGSHQGQGKGVLKFLQCHTSISTCTVGEPIKTSQTKSYLAASKETQTHIVDVFEPTQGTSYAEISLSGKCGVIPVGVNKVTGSVAAELIPVEKEVQEGLMVFPATPITSIKHEGTPVTLPRLKFSSINLTFSALYGARLSTTKTYGVFGH